MDDVVGVCVAHCLTDVLKHRQEPSALVTRRGPLTQLIVERAPLDELHRQERSAVGECAEIVDSGHPRMLKLTRDARFVKEASADTGLGTEVVLQQLHGDFAIEN